MSREQRAAAAEIDPTSGAAGAEDADALFLAAVGHHQAGRLTEAETGYRRLLALQPNRADVLFNLAAALRQQNRLHDAADVYRQTVALRPNYADAHYNLGNTLMVLGRPNDAIAAYRSAVAAKPGFAQAHGNLGVALKAQGALDEAVAVFRRAITVAPDSVDAHANLGATLSEFGRPAEAADAYREAIRLRPDYAEAHYNLGTVLDALGRPDEAAAAYRAAIAANPRLTEAHSNLGNVLRGQGRLDEATACFRRAIALAPERPGLHYNLGNALNDRGTLEEAATAYRAAIALKPDHADAHANLAIVLMNQGRIDEADAEFRRALSIARDNADTRSNWLFCLNYRADADAERVFAAHRDWEAHLDRSAPVIVHSNDRTPTRQLKIGYVSPDFRMHSVAYFLEPLLAAHDRRAVDVTCYAEVARPDHVTARLQRLADHWVSTVGMSDAALAARVQDDGIDILIDCAGHTAHNRLKVFARKPAPVQATWLGYPNTAGLSAIDYRLVDAVTDPPGAADMLASERLVRLPGGFLCYGGASDAPEPAPPPCLTAGAVTFGSFNNPAKLSPTTLDAWAALLKRLPNARLLLKGKPFADEATRALYRERLAALGVAAERVELTGWTAASAHHLAFYERVDVALDPFPYNGTTTTCEALWMGVPVVSLRGDRHCGRVGASLLSQIGAHGWIAETVDDYVARAAALAADPEQLCALRRDLRARVAASPLCDRVAFTRSLETAYRQMWQAWCATAQA
jgi:protein O-GlcNAc transferase